MERQAWGAAAVGPVAARYSVPQAPGSGGGGAGGGGAGAAAAERHRQLFPRASIHHIPVIQEPPPEEACVRKAWSVAY